MLPRSPFDTPAKAKMFAKLMAKPWMANVYEIREKISVGGSGLIRKEVGNQIVWYAAKRKKKARITAIKKESKKGPISAWRGNGLILMFDHLVAII